MKFLSTRGCFDVNDFTWLSDRFRPSFENINGLIAAEYNPSWYFWWIFNIHIWHNASKCNLPLTRWTFPLFIYPLLIFLWLQVISCLLMQTHLLPLGKCKTSQKKKWTNIASVSNFKKTNNNLIIYKAITWKKVLSSGNSMSLNF